MVGVWKFVSSFTGNFIIYTSYSSISRTFVKSNEGLRVQNAVLLILFYNLLAYQAVVVSNHLDVVAHVTDHSLNTRVELLLLQAIPMKNDDLIFKIQQLLFGRLKYQGTLTEP